MPQSLARLHIHLVFSTKHRAPLLHDSIREAMHSYMAGVLQAMDCPAVLVNSVEDHIHILFRLNRTTTMAALVEEVKTTSSKWIKTQGPEFAKFAWQVGYGAFAVSESVVPTVRDYITKQREHHSKSSFQDEYRQILARNCVDYDEQYVWE